MDDGGKSPGQVCYEAYRAAAGGVSLVSGQPLPEFSEQDPRIQGAWEAGAAAVAANELGLAGLRVQGTEYRGNT